MMLSCEVDQGKINIFWADQTELRGCLFKIDWSRQSRSNRAEWVARSKLFKPIKPSFEDFVIKSTFFGPIKPRFEDLFSKSTGADKADQTELSGWPDQSSSSRSNRASKTLSSNHHFSSRSNRASRMSLQIPWKPIKPIKPSLRGEQTFKTLQADQTGPRRCLQSQPNRVLKSFTDQWEPTKPIKPSLEGDQMICSASFQADQTELREDCPIEGALIDHFNIYRLYN
ncbi:hypothetical protein JCGZ_04548 [Jatropha curcas]|uniref:Uncharacterized protein n=1 Tax=Jatropha curcas TaxID=180498 RepID=A0A067LPY9_JATCU|nr:hypothetical protein JCGZ_04548 [Jatropha curcas]